jgi:SRSO17 transposase
MIAQGGIVEPTAVRRWSEALEELHGRIAHRFARSEARERVRRYLMGLLGRVERKNGWQLAEAIGEAEPQGIQRLLNAAKWDTDLVREDLRDYAVERLDDEGSGVLVVDETGFLKKGAAFVDRALYLPKEWAQDIDRRTEAGVPEGVRFADKLKLAKRLLERAFEANVPASWVVADSFYGRSHGFRSWLEKRGCPYAVMVPKTNAVRYRPRRKKIERLVERLPEDAWALMVPAGEGPDRRRPWEWACLELHGDPEKGMGRWLLVRRRPGEPEDVAFYQVYGPEGTSPAKLVDVCHKRWKVEDCFAEAKGEVGLDHYEVRRWDAWHRYVTLCLLAHAFLVVSCLAARDEEDAGKRGISALA